MNWSGLEKRWSKKGKEEPEVSIGRDTAISYTKEHLHFPSADFNRQGEKASKRQISVKYFKIKFVILRKKWIAELLCSKNDISEVFYCKILYRHKQSCLNTSLVLKLKINQEKWAYAQWQFAKIFKQRITPQKHDLGMLHCPATAQTHAWAARWCTHMRTE